MKRALLATLAGAAVALGACGGDGDDGEARKDPFEKINPEIQKSKELAAPRWEPIATLRGTKPQTRRFNVSKRAIQWRARWRCTKGRLALSVEPKPRSAAERSGGRCPGRGTSEWIQSGPQKLRIDARGGWRVVIEQQVDTALNEPPLAAMRAPGAEVIASGDFYRLERRGRGKAKLFRLPDGRHALRFEDFSTSANTDLFVWLSSAKRPRNTKQAQAPHFELRLLKSTLGDQNYIVPRNVNVDRIRSIVIWCEPIQIAYTAAALKR